jgi:hypothetical protein
VFSNFKHLCFSFFSSLSFISCWPGVLDLFGTVILPLKQCTHRTLADCFPYLIYYFFSTGFYSPYQTLAFLNGLLNPQTFDRTPWLGDQSNAWPPPKRRTTQHRNTQTHIHAPSRIRTGDLNVQVLIDSTCLRLLGY